MPENNCTFLLKRLYCSRRRARTAAGQQSHLWRSLSTPTTATRWSRATPSIRSLERRSWRRTWSACCVSQLKTFLRKTFFGHFLPAANGQIPSSCWSCSWGYFIRSFLYCSNHLSYYIQQFCLSSINRFDIDKVASIFFCVFICHFWIPTAPRANQSLLKGAIWRLR